MSAHDAETGLRIERATAARIPALIAFLDRAYGRGLFAGDEGRARWRWLYERCPSVMGEGPPSWICLDGDEIVGHCGALPIDVLADGAVVRMAWARDLIVDPRARGRGVGSRLMAATIAAAGRCLILGEYEGIVRMYGRLGYRDRGRVPLFVKVLDPRAAVAALPAPGPARVVASRLVALLQIRPPAGGDGHDVDAVARLDERFDRWWAGVETGLRGVTVRRTSALLNWRYSEHPSHRYRLLAATRGGDLRALAVTRIGTVRGLRAGLLVELLADPSDAAAMAAALRAAEAYMRSEGAVLSRAAVRHGPTARALLRAGYLPAPSPVRFMAATASGSADADPVLRRRDWYLNGGDSDIDVL